VREREGQRATGTVPMQVEQGCGVAPPEGRAVSLAYEFPKARYSLVESAVTPKRLASFLIFLSSVRRVIL